MLFARNKWHEPYSRFEVVYQLIKKRGFLDLKNRSKYIYALEKDFQLLTEILHINSRYLNETNGSLVFNFPFHYILAYDSLIFDACTFLSEDECNIRTSIGTLLSLDDFFTRITCNKQILSIDYNKKLKPISLWNGTKCFWTERGGIIYPEKRYYNYKAQKIDNHIDVLNLNVQLQKLGVDCFLSEFYNGIPFRDYKRINLSLNLIHIAFCWIFLHEESHYLDGHLNYLSKERSILGIDEIKDNTINTSNEFDIFLRKAMEYRADGLAFDGVFQLFFLQSCTPYRSHLFTRLKHWKLRIIFVAVGSVLLLLQKAREIEGSSQSYPSPQSRILQLITRLYANCFYFNKVGITEFEFNRAILGGLQDLTGIADLLYCITDFDEQERKSHYENHIKKIRLDDHRDKEAQPFVKYSNIFYHEKFDVDTIISKILDFSFGGYQKNEADESFWNLWFAEHDSMIQFMSEINFELFMKPYRRMAIKKGHILKIDRDFDH